MQALTIDRIVAIFFGITTLVTSVIALRYTSLDHKRKVEEVVGTGRQATMFLSRNSMLKEMLAMYDRSEKDDVIWVQCVGCGDYSSSVRSKVLEAAGKGVRFKLIMNSYAPAIDQLRSIFEPLSSADLLEGQDNTLRIQGLSNKEVIIGLPGVDSYTGLRIRDVYLVAMIKDWYDTRFKRLKSQRLAILLAQANENNSMPDLPQRSDEIV